MSYPYNPFQHQQKNKYHAKKTEVNGIVFDSAKEAKRYSELVLMQRAHQISGLRRQVKYELIPTQRDADGNLIEKECYYKADFVYFKHGKTIVEDTKGMKTPDYIIKRKLMYYKYGIEIQEV